MYKLGILLVYISIGLINCDHFDIKGGHLRGPSFWSSYKAKVVALPSPTIEHIAPVQQRLVIGKVHQPPVLHHPIRERIVVEEKVHHHHPVQERIVVEEKVHHHHPVQERIVVEEKVHHHHPVQERIVVEEKVHHHHPVQERVVVEEKVHHVEPHHVEQVRVVEGIKGQTVIADTKSHHHHHLVDLAHERRHEELHQQREQREQLREIQHFQHHLQHQQIRQQLEQQKHLEHAVVVQQKSDQILEGKTNVQHIEQIVQQKQERNEKLTDEEEAVAEPFPLIPKTHFTCDDKPYLPGMYADIETGCRVYHFCFANAEKAEIVQQVHQDKIDVLHNDVHHVNSLLITSLPRPEQQQMKSFFCGEGTLFNQRLLICDHAVNVICPESVHFYSANLEFGKAAPEPSAQPIAQLVQQKEITKTNHIVQVKEPVILHQHVEPVRIVQHHIAPIVQVKEKIVQQPIVQVREQIIQQPVVQVKENVIVQHPEPARIVREQVKIGHIVQERPVIVHQKNEIVSTTTNVASNDVIDHHAEDLGSFASSSDRNSDWRENPTSWSTSRTVHGLTNRNSSTNSNTISSTISSTNRLSEDAEWSRNSNNDERISRIRQGRQKEKVFKFGGEKFDQPPETKFACELEPFSNGIYADVHLGCRVFHICMNKNRTSYLCPSGTLFSQKELKCDLQKDVECAASSDYYVKSNENYQSESSEQ